MTHNIRWWLGTIMILLAACRASNPQSNSAEFDAQDDKIWYGADGSMGACDPLDKTCTEFKDDKEFIDLCVDKGFQARTCGCAIKCNGSIPYTATAAVPQAAKKPDAPRGSCSDEHKKMVETLLKDKVPGGSFDRCLETHVCAGNVGSCEGEDLKKSSELRALTRYGCADEVLGAICRDGSVDSFRCPEADIAILSKAWAGFRGKDAATKRCIKKLVCSDDQAGCGPNDLPQALAVKASTSREGCDYWLREFCKFGW